MTPGSSVAVQTVTGRVEFTAPYPVALMHEHTLIAWNGSELDHRAQPDLAEGGRRAAEDLARVAGSTGLGLLVDASVPDLGRDVRFSRAVSQASGVAIMACTGFYKANWGLPWYWQNQETGDLADFMSHEILEGIGDTGIRAGLIKVATQGATFTAAEERVLLAAGQVSAALDVPIITHTDPEGWAEGNIGARQLALLLEGGADPRRVAIGHACGTTDVDHLAQLCERGAFVAFDRVGSTHIASDEQRATTLAALVAEGHLSRLLVSHDHHMLWRRRRTPPDRYPPKSFDLIHRTFRPLLRAAGVLKPAIEEMLRANPFRLLASGDAGPGSTHAK